MGDEEGESGDGLQSVEGENVSSENIIDGDKKLIAIKLIIHHDNGNNDCSDDGYVDKCSSNYNQHHPLCWVRFLDSSDE